MYSEYIRANKRTPVSIYIMTTAELLRRLPPELQNKVFFYAAEHPCAVIIKRFFRCDECGAPKCFIIKCHYCGCPLCLACGWFDYMVIQRRGHYVCIDCIMQTIGDYMS